MDAAKTVLADADVVVVDDRIVEIGTHLPVPQGAMEIDASGGIVMPGMIDTHRHLWQTVMRGYGADWTLTQYFVWYYLEYGKLFRPEDIHAGNALGLIEALDAGVTTTVDWSHGLSTIEHGEAALDALRTSPSRSILAYGNIHAAPWEWATSADFRAFAQRAISIADDRFAFQLAFDVTGDPTFPERVAFDVARELGVPISTHAGVWGATNDEGIRLMYDGGYMDDRTVYVHAATLNPDSYHKIAATGGSVSVSTESEESAGQGYPTTFRLREYGIDASLSNDTSVWWSGDLFSAMRATLSADRAMEHLQHHESGETVTHLSLRADNVVEMATVGGARAIGRSHDLGTLEVGKKADIVLVKNDASPVMFPLLNPYGHLVYQAQRGDVHTVMVDGKVVKYEHRLVGIELERTRSAVSRTVEYLRSKLGEEQWMAGMNPEIPPTQVKDNPYTYTYKDR
jgi:cytosine/adenosine deaminase-related metal-dependent hydrolase